MKANVIRMLIFFFLCAFIFTSGCARPGKISQWERKCEACHDGKTKLGEKVVIGKEQLKSKYKSLDAFINACSGSPSCMNILKHNKELLRAVGKEIGIEDK
jgi:hypothetical protein